MKKKFILLVTALFLLGCLLFAHDFVLEIDELGNTILVEYLGDCVQVQIPDGVTVIGDGAFTDCFLVKGVVIPDSVTSIGDWAFFLVPIVKAYSDS